MNSAYISPEEDLLLLNSTVPQRRDAFTTATSLSAFLRHPEGFYSRCVEASNYFPQERTSAIIKALLQFDPPWASSSELGFAFYNEDSIPGIQDHSRYGMTASPKLKATYSAKVSRLNTLHSQVLAIITSGQPSSEKEQGFGDRIINSPRNTR